MADVRSGSGSPSFQGKSDSLRVGPSIGIVGRSAAIHRVLDFIDLYGPHSFPVLILGDTGTGKELVATALHAAGENLRPPVTLNCANLTADLAESQLFGHEVGAFTGARRKYRGAIERAHGGTLFLDEIGELAPRVQAKLLRALESGEFQRLGSECLSKSQFRLLAATGRNLDRMVQTGDFRSDLYYRLGSAVISLPPLRERREDISLLAQEMLRALAGRTGRRTWRLTREARRILTLAAWPGNVRQLRSIMETAAGLSPGDVIEAGLVADLLNRTNGSRAEEDRGVPMTLRKAVQRAEAAAIEHALRVVAGRVDEAAELLDVSPATLYRKMKKRGGSLPGNPEAAE